LPTVYLHIGRGKTGTTALQRYMASVADSLAAQGIHYVRAGGGARGSGHQDFAKSFIRNLPDYMTPPSQPDAARRSVAGEIAHCGAEHIVLSSENFELADPGILRDFFCSLPLSYDVKVIYFARSQDELAESEYNQMVRVKGENRSFKEYAISYISEYDYSSILSPWTQEFGAENIICKIYDGVRSNIVSQFMECMPIVLSQSLDARILAPNGAGINASVGLRALVFARILNGIDLGDRFKFYETIFRGLVDHDIPALLFDSSEARQFREQFAASNKVFTRQYMGRELADLGGRRYTDEQRDAIRSRIKAIKLDSW